VYILSENLKANQFPVGWNMEGFMAGVETKPDFAPRAGVLGALAAGATAIGLLAIGWISIGKLRFFSRTQNY
jgi:hypothetical protein